MRRGAPVLLAALALAAAGCGSLRKAAFPKPVFSLENVRLTRLTLADATLECTIKAVNSDSREFVGRNMQCGIYVNDRLIGVGIKKDNIVVPGNGQITFPFTVTATFQDMLRTVEVYRAKEVRTVPYELRGSVELWSPIGTVAVDWQHEGTIPVPRAPGIGLKQVRVKEAGIFRYWILFTFDVENPNTFSMTVSDLSYSLKLADEQVARGNLTKTWVIKPETHSRIELPVETRPSKLARALRLSMEQGRIKFDLSGHMGFKSLLGDTDFAFQKAGTFEFRGKRPDETEGETGTGGDEGRATQPAAKPADAPAPAGGSPSR